MGLTWQDFARLSRLVCAVPKEVLWGICTKVAFNPSSIVLISSIS